MRRQAIVYCEMSVSLQLTRPCSYTLKCLRIVLDPQLGADHSDVRFGVLSFFTCVSMAEPVATLSIWESSGPY